MSTQKRARPRAAATTWRIIERALAVHQGAVLTPSGLTTLAQGILQRRPTSSDGLVSEEDARAAERRLREALPADLRPLFDDFEQWVIWRATADGVTAFLAGVVRGQRTREQACRRR